MEFIDGDSSSIKAGSKKSSKSSKRSKKKKKKKKKKKRSKNEEARKSVTREVPIQVEAKKDARHVVREDPVRYAKEPSKRMPFSNADARSCGAKATDFAMDAKSEGETKKMLENGYLDRSFSDLFREDRFEDDCDETHREELETFQMRLSGKVPLW
eukprot:g4560.t1